MSAVGWWNSAAVSVVFVLIGALAGIGIALLDSWIRGTREDVEAARRPRGAAKDLPQEHGLRKAA